VADEKREFRRRIPQIKSGYLVPVFRRQLQKFRRVLVGRRAWQKNVSVREKETEGEQSHVQQRSYSQ
jgi:hypothetical protein